MSGKISRDWRRNSLRVAVAILIVQLIYWLAINPVLLVPNPTPEKLPVSQVEAARLPSPDLASAAQARFAPIELPWDDCCEAGYRSVRLDFDLPQVPADGLAIVPMLGSDNFRIYISTARFYLVTAT